MMVLYHAISIYQLLTCICLQTNHHQGQEAICILPDFIVKKYPDYKQLESCHIFSRVVLFPYSKMPVTDSMEIVGQAGDSMCREILPRGLDDFEEIYCGGTHFAFASYLVARKIHFNYLEDASGIFLEIDDFRQNHYRKHTLMYKLTEGNGLYDGSCPYVKQIYADVPTLMKEDNPRLVPFNVMEELGKMSGEELSNIRQAFGVCEIDSLDYDNSTVFITDSAEIIPLEKQILRNALTIDYFAHEPNLIVKPHPDDWICHSVVLRNALTLPRCFPMELMRNFVQDEGAHVIAYNSAILRNLKAKDLQTFDWPYQLGEYVKVHRYYAVYSLYKELKKHISCRLEIRGGNKSILDNWARHDGEEIRENQETTSNICLFIGSRDFSDEVLSKILENPSNVVLMDELYKPAMEHLMDSPVKYIPKVLSIMSDGGDILEQECIHVLTRNKDYSRIAELFAYCKTLDNSKITVKTEEMTSAACQRVSLREFLGARERQLMEALEEREYLKSML